MVDYNRHDYVNSLDGEDAEEEPCAAAVPGDQTHEMTQKHLKNIQIIHSTRESPPIWWLVHATLYATLHATSVPHVPP